MFESTLWGLRNEPRQWRLEEGYEAVLPFRFQLIHNMFVHSRLLVDIDIVPSDALGVGNFYKRTVYLCHSPSNTYGERPEVGTENILGNLTLWIGAAEVIPKLVYFPSRL